MRGYAYSYAECDTHTNCDPYAKCDAHAECDADADRDTNTYTAPPHAQAAANTVSSADSVIVVDMR